MDAALAGLSGTVIGALIGGSAAFFGPLFLQRRKERFDGRKDLRNETARRVDLVNDVGLRCRAWLVYLVRVLQDAEAGRTVTLAEFDEKCEGLRSAAESALAQAAHAGYELSHSGLADALRGTEDQVRVALLLPPRPQALAQLRNEASAYFPPREVVRMRMLEEVVHHADPTNPLAGTIFENRRATLP
ncbi:hypothetical protein AB0C96_09365 [Streptomyces sp. NPDC048506]|uniref:hypothetical protein n=1 Tax=Streptomyces sp. NPDC048506 TaxID=3155028 RepID=UPI00344AA31C